jgi:hypothetical protein
METVCCVPQPNLKVAHDEDPTAKAAMRAVIFRGIRIFDFFLQSLPLSKVRRKTKGRAN